MARKELSQTIGLIICRILQLFGLVFIYFAYEAAGGTDSQVLMKLQGMPSTREIVICSFLLAFSSVAYAAILFYEGMQEKKQFAGKFNEYVDHL